MKSHATHLAYWIFFAVSAWTAMACAGSTEPAPPEVTASAWRLAGEQFAPLDEKDLQRVEGQLRDAVRQLGERLDGAGTKKGKHGKNTSNGRYSIPN